ncbi:uncharacterized protein C8A04DRAFT_14746 [Dichotomopilus funicola]|uniref:DNA mismatch repair protein PMS1 n=1 Tax=Dichotomopilus funicola TaxID=1934379 RepID=A0AAN6ZIN0_9PEZI|nr:hypothetical protein C8A04DRAFT_14746 [Dichotomopilus funicola]
MASSATIKAIESSTVRLEPIHQIQSGQVIVDLCSVAKELVENSIDAGATTIDVRFKNQGLDSIEVQDNGSGISSHNYESIALKHYTSKLASYDDLSELQTFGFRGEALSSLCALSRFAVVTCTQEDAPRATKLDFETSGKLKSTGVVSGQRGTTVIIEDLFRNLPVRRRELERNIKREWGKVINLLNQYACVQTGVKFTVSQQPTKGKRMILFSTKGNPTTRENIINVFGVKTMNALIGMDLKVELVPTAGPLNKGKARADGSATEVRVLGHVSRPTHGEGRQTPDRQMFYVNGRPCGLPQFAKVFNEVYRSYNASQSPFIFADIQLDTHLYDVNVSPDKRTILLHDQGQMLDNLRESLVELFETQDVTVPVSQVAALKQTPFKTASGRAWSVASVKGSSAAKSRAAPESEDEDNIGDVAEEEGASEEEHDELPAKKKTSSKPATSSRTVTLLSRWIANSPDSNKRSASTRKDEPESEEEEEEEEEDEEPSSRGAGPAAESNANDESEGKDVARQRTLGQGEAEGSDDQPPHSPRLGSGPTQSSVLAIAPPSQPPEPRAINTTATRLSKRTTSEVATITIGDRTVTSVIGNPAKRLKVDEPTRSSKVATTKGKKKAPLPSFGGRLSQMFSASANPNYDAEENIEDLSDPDEDMEEDAEDSSEALSEDGQDEEEALFVSQDENEARDGGDAKEAEEGSGETQDTEQTGDTECSSRPVTPDEPLAHSPSCRHDNPEDDGDDVEDDVKTANEDQGAQTMIDAAASAAAGPSEEGEKRSEVFVKGRPKRKDMTLNLAQQVKINTQEIQRRITSLADHLPAAASSHTPDVKPDGLDADDAEERLSLKISKSDFAQMRIVGQFNLGFVLAVREAPCPTTGREDTGESPNDDDELFIIDQHASDEKYNFERLQATTTVQSQRLVQPKTLDLTALEEEIILEHLPDLERNGFTVHVDTSGAQPVGSRVQLLSLPLSRETTFSVADLEELIFLLADNPTSSASTVPRPSKVRKMFAMRACRSSIMIGRALSRRQMEKVVRHMGEMEQPWNCPHGRPTMRHLCGLGGAWDGKGWMEGEGERTDWGAWARERKE